MLQEENSYSCKQYTIRIIQGVLFVRLNKLQELTHAITLDIIKRRKKMANGEPLPLILYVNNIMGLSRDARTLLASKEGQDGLKAVAIVASNRFSNMLARFFLAIHRLRIPIKIYDSEHEAKKWVERFKTPEPLGEAME